MRRGAMEASGGAASPAWSRASAKRRKAGSVLQELGRRIVGGAFGPGELLPTESELGLQLGIGRSSLREALWALAQKGLIEARARRGTVVLARDRWDRLDPDVLGWMAASPDAELLIDLLEVRSFIEPQAARLAAQRATAAEILAIERAFHGMAAAVRDDIEACCEHDLAFHEHILTAAHNSVLNRLAAAIRAALLTQVKVGTATRESYESSLAEHWAVAAAIRARAPEEAERAMRDLLAGTARDLAPVLTSPAADGAGTTAPRENRSSSGDGRPTRPAGS
jgi:GntR family transcriptional regulator, galactonate operon transcriptional repressor